MKGLVFLLAGLAASGAAAQDLASLAHGWAGPAAITTTNNNYVGGAAHEVNPGPDAITYTCASTSNRIILIADTASGVTLTMADTGGQMASATVLGSGQWPSSDLYRAWNVGCAAGANTFTLSASSGAAMILQLAEYSGIGSGGDGAAFANGTSTSCTASATAAQSGDLSVAYVGFGFGIAYLGQTGSFNPRLYNSTNATPTIYYFGITLDALNQASGSLSFSATFPSAASNSRCMILNIPGTPAANPNFNPVLKQSASKCNTSTGNSVAANYNVTSGDVLVYTFKSETDVTPTSVTDSLSTTYTLAVKKSQGSNRIWIYTGKATGSGADTVTLTATGASYPCSSITEFSGLTGTVTDTGGQTTSAGTMTWAQTVTNAKSLVYAAVAAYHSGTSFTFGGTSYAMTSAFGGADAMGGEWARVLSSGTSTPIITLSTADNNVGASIVLQ